MASLHFSPLLIATSIAIFISLFSLASSLTCDTQKLQKSYTNCTNLPTFNATLHFNYTATTNFLDIAFAIDSPKVDGWVSWGVNPSGPTMFGTGAFIAVKHNGTVKVDTYNLVSVQVPYKKEKLAFDVKDLSVEDANGVITIFASFKVPEKAKNLSQLWQVGPVDAGGVIKSHAAEKVNDDSVAPLKVGSGASVAPSPAPSTDHNDHKNGGVTIGESYLGFYLVLILLGFMSM